MGEPTRIQLRRTKGWRKPEGCIVVARPSKWGNPFKVERVDCSFAGMCWRITRAGIVHDDHLNSLTDALQCAVDRFALHIGPMGSIEPDDFAEWIAPLVGHDLACWCPLDQPCHADVLLELANTPVALSGDPTGGDA